MARSRGQKSKPFSPFRKRGDGMKSRARVLCSGTHRPLVATREWQRPQDQRPYYETGTV